VKLEEMLCLRYNSLLNEFKENDYRGQKNRK
jgi:hypothetical protein